MDISLEQFEELVREAIDAIPDEYSDVHNNVVFKVADRPSEEQVKRANLQPHSSLLGLFEGVTRPQRSGGASGTLPSVITVYRRPMIDMFKNIHGLKKQVYETVWHEVAHYFGLNHQAIKLAKK